MYKALPKNDTHVVRPPKDRSMGQEAAKVEIFTKEGRKCAYFDRQFTLFWNY